MAAANALRRELFNAAGLLLLQTAELEEAMLLAPLAKPRLHERIPRIARENMITMQNLRTS